MGQTPAVGTGKEGSALGSDDSADSHTQCGVFCLDYFIRLQRSAAHPPNCQLANCSEMFTVKVGLKEELRGIRGSSSTLALQKFHI